MIFISPTYALLTVFDSYWISKAVILGFGRYNSTLVDAFFFKKKKPFLVLQFSVLLNSYFVQSMNTCYLTRLLLYDLFIETKFCVYLIIYTYYSLLLG